MPTYFETDRFVCGRKILSLKTFIRDKVTGQTAYPDTNLIASFHAIARHMNTVALTAEERAFVGHYATTRFCTAALDHEGLLRMMFVSSDPQKFVETALMPLRDPATVRDLGLGSGYS